VGVNVNVFLLDFFDDNKEKKETKKKDNVFSSCIFL